MSFPPHALGHPSPARGFVPLPTVGCPEHDVGNALSKCVASSSRFRAFLDSHTVGDTAVDFVVNPVSSGVNAKVITLVEYYSWRLLDAAAQHSQLVPDGAPNDRPFNSELRGHVREHGLEVPVGAYEDEVVPMD